MTDEHLLIERAQRGEMNAFRELVERSKINVYRLAYDLTGSRHDAEDLSQDVFVKAYRSLSQFRHDAKWSTWLYRITVNTCMDRRKVKSFTQLSFRDDLDEGVAAGSMKHSSSLSPEKSAEAGLIRQEIEKALDRLTSKERSVFVLRHYHDQSLKQISETLGISEGTVKSFLFRAIRRLQKALAFYKEDLELENP